VPIPSPPTAQIELHRVVRALQKASRDERVKGLTLHLSSRENLGGLAMVQVGTCCSGRST